MRLLWPAMPHTAHVLATPMLPSERACRASKSALLRSMDSAMRLHGQSRQACCIGGNPTWPHPRLQGCTACSCMSDPCHPADTMFACTTCQSLAGKVAQIRMHHRVACVLSCVVPSNKTVYAGVKVRTACAPRRGACACGRPAPRGSSPCARPRAACAWSDCCA